MFYLYNHPQFPNPDTAPAKELLNCVRLLTRVLPFIYEQKHQSKELDKWYDDFFWGRRRVRKHTQNDKNDLASFVNSNTQQKATNKDTTIPDNTDRKQKLAPKAGSSLSSNTEEQIFDEEEFDRQASQFYDAKPLGEQLVDTAFGLLFCAGFTVPKTSGSKITYSIWETGVGCTTPINSTGEHDSNKIEILRFLLALISDCLYTSPSALPLEGSRFLTYMTTQTDRRMAMAILCSLLNTTLKYSPRWKVPYDHMLVSDGHKVLITYSLQFLEALLIYPIPDNAYAHYCDENTTQLKNVFRHLCSKIHKAEDLQFIADSLVKMLSQPIHASSSYLPGSRQEIPWTLELAMLFWDLVQCNKKFKSFLIRTERMHDFLILLLYYTHEKAQDSSKLNLVRLCAYELLYLTGDAMFSHSLSKKFTGQSLLPNAIQLSSFNGSYGDYLIIQLIKTITNKNTNLNFLVPTFLNCIYNISPYVQNICYQASSSLVQLCAGISNPSFLFASESNHFLLETVLKSINLMIECNFTSNRNLLFLIMKNECVFLTIKSLTLEDHVEHILASVSKNSGDVKITLSYAELEPDTNFVIDYSDDEDNGATSNDENEGNDEKELLKKMNSTSLENEEKKRNNELNAIASPKKDKGKGVAGSKYDLKKSNSFGSNSLNISEGVLWSGDRGNFVPSTTWTSTWLPLLPIYTISTVISHLRETIPYFKSTNQTLESKLDPSKAIDSISRVKSIPGVTFYSMGSNSISSQGGGDDTQKLPSDFEISKFGWNRGSLGWYEGILWGCIFQAEREVTIVDSSNMMIHSNNCMPVGVWNNTNIKLFRLQETAPRGPSLLRPKGAVDAVADSMMQKFGQLRNPTSKH